MKRALLNVFLGLLFCLMLFGEGVVLADTIFIPSNVTPLGAEYTHLVMHSNRIYIKIFCKRDDGSYVLYLASHEASGARYTLPEKIDFVVDKTLIDKIVWKRDNYIYKRR